MINFSSYWILPLLFMFHDFEELVFVPYWLKDHNPKINGRVLFGGVNRSDILAAGIWEEFCIYLLLAAVAYIMGSPLLVATAIFYLYSLVTLTKAPLWEWIIVVVIMFIFFISNLKFIHWIMAETMHKLR